MESSTWTVVDKDEIIIGFIAFQNPQSILKARTEALLKFGLSSKTFNMKVFPFKDSDVIGQAHE